VTKIFGLPEKFVLIFIYKCLVFKGTATYTPPLDFCSFNYFFIGPDVRIADHEIIPLTFLVLAKKPIF
jgi:hypothetical protein